MNFNSSYRSFCLIFFSFFLQLLFSESTHKLITSKAFQDHCDYYYDAWHHTNINTYQMKNNCVIFVSNETLEKFFAAVHPQIKVKYILVSHGGDYSFPSRHIRFANDPRIIVWFTMNMDKTHPKVKPLPIGFTHEHHYDIHDQTDDLFDVLNRINRTSFKKRHLLYLSFVNRLPCRRDVYNLFANVSFCYNPGMLDFENYLETLASSKFVLAPRAGRFN